MRAELGIAEERLEQVVRAAYRLLGLITFFTAVGGNEIRARSLHARQHRARGGGTCPHGHAARVRSGGGDRLAGARRGRLVRAARERAGCAPRAATTSSRTATCVTIKFT